MNALYAILLFLGPPPIAGEQETKSEASPVEETTTTNSTSTASSTAAPTSTTTTSEPAAPASVAEDPTPVTAPAPAGAAESPSPPPAVGQAPLPPPPAAIDTSRIKRGVWRGSVWVGPRMAIAGPVGGTRPAESNVVSFGGGIEAGWRINNFIGIGGSFTRQPHERAYQDAQLEDGEDVVVQDDGHMNQLDLLIFRLFAPIPSRAQPWIDVGFGPVIYEEAFTSAGEVGGTVRSMVGLDGWVGRHVTLNAAFGYRATGVAKTWGHILFGQLGFTLHW